MVYEQCVYARKPLLIMAHAEGFEPLNSGSVVSLRVIVYTYVQRDIRVKLSDVNVVLVT